jgi:hypothetical protein
MDYTQTTKRGGRNGQFTKTIEAANESKLIIQDEMVKHMEYMKELTEKVFPHIYHILFQVN